MNKDIRLKVTFPNHKKTIKLIHLAGHESFYSLIQLWCYVAQNHPKGILKDYDKDDLEIAARWSGERGLFAKSIVRKEIGFVKKIAKGFEINDWEEHNPYVFHADERSEKARKAARKRWEPIKDAGSGDASSIQEAMPQASTSNAPSPEPLPLPPPNPKPIKKKDIYGEFKNISLAKEEYEKLSVRYNSNCDDMIERMSQHIETKTKDPYKSHYAAILKNEDWLVKKGKVQKSTTDNYVGLTKKDYRKGVGPNGEIL